MTPISDALSAQGPHESRVRALFPDAFAFAGERPVFSKPLCILAFTNRSGSNLLADYLPYTKTVRIPQPPPQVPACRDVLDAPFMHLAVAGRAHVLVSGDQDLLAIAEAFEQASACPVLTLDAFCRQFLG